MPEGELFEVARVVGDAMCTAYDLVVPLKVSFKAGANWAELQPFPVG